MPSLASGAGFALFEHGNRAMAMGGSFTAVADDPSAMYWNPAGMAFQNEKGVQVMNGFTLITLKQDFYGDPPYPGDGYHTAQKDQIFYPLHFYLVYPINDKLTFGTGVNTPFGLGTWWDDDHAGRFNSKRTDLCTFNLAASAAYKLNDSIALSLGVDYRIGRIDLTRNIGFINPYTQALTDVGQVHMYTYDLSSDGLGFNASVMAKLGKGFSAGLLYRSEVEVNFKGKASFTQYETGNADFDALLRSRLPFGQKVPLKTVIDFPDYLALGVAWANDKWTITGQWCAMGWESFQRLPMTFPEHPILNSAVEEGYEDTNTYRAGAEYRINDTWAVQAGYLFDETPQPTQSMTPMLADGDRTGYSIGFSWNHQKMRVDFGYLYLPMDGRSTNGESWDGYNGNYKGGADLAGLTLSMTF